MSNKKPSIEAFYKVHKLEIDSSWIAYLEDAKMFNIDRDSSEEAKILFIEQYYYDFCF